MAIDQDKIRQVYEAHLTDLKRERDRLQVMHEEAQRQFDHAEDHLGGLASQITALDERMSEIKRDMKREFGE